MTTPVKAKPISARRLLELSQLNPQVVQQEAMGTDVAFDKFVTYISSQVRADLNGRITAATIHRTIEAASTLTVTINDYDRIVLRSGMLSNAMDVQIDGLWFRLAAVDKQSDILTLTFEDREIAVLRTYNKWRIVQRGVMTRAEFVLSLLREVKEFNIPYVIPELHKIQNIEQYPGDLKGTDTIINKGRGIAKGTNDNTPKDIHNHGESSKTNPKLLLVKGIVATKDQITTADIILQVGESMGVSRKLKTVALMVAITETLLKNEPGGPAAHNTTNDTAGDDSAGVFQQRPSWGSYVDRTTVETAARLFFTAAIKVDKDLGDVAYWVLAANIQHPKAEFERRYALYRTEAERFVNAFGDTSVPVTTANLMAANLTPQGPFYFFRGLIIDKSKQKVRKPENTWSCYQRLADEVDWRAFFISGTFYFISETDLMQQLPLATLSEFTPGLNSIDGNYDRAKKAATLTLMAEVGRWKVPPGSVVVLTEMGPFNGRWIVNSYSRDLIGSNRIATIVLKKPRPQLPEPLTSNQKSLLTSWYTPASDPATSPGNSVLVDPTHGFLQVGRKYLFKRFDQGTDFCTDPGGHIIAPGDGILLRNARDTASDGGFGPSYPIVRFSSGYYKGETMYIGHTLSQISGTFVPFKKGDVLSITGTTGVEAWNGNASEPGWCEIGYCVNDAPGPFGQRHPFQ